MTSHAQSMKTFQDIRGLLAPLKCHKKNGHTFAFLARVWACKESYARNLQLSARRVSEKRFQLVRTEVERILKEEIQPASSQ